MHRLISWPGTIVFAQLAGAARALLYLSLLMENLSNGSDSSDGNS
jgi:hypothetical protein